MTRILAVLLVLMSLLPVANWIPGGEVDESYLSRLGDWGLGAALCVSVGGLFAFLYRRRAVVAVSHREPVLSERSLVMLVAGAALVAYVLIALFVFSGRPLLIDEIVYLLQAQDLVAGQLTHAIPGPKPFFAILHEVDFGARAYGQYPVGGPAMLVPGVMLGAPWLVGPMIGALCVLLFWHLLLVVEPAASARWRVAAVALFAAAPFGAFLFGSHMNHAPTLLWLLIATLALANAVRDDASPWWGLVAGLGLGLAASIRPLDAAAFALPAAAWLLWRARHGRAPLAALLLSGVGVLLPMLLVFWSNAATTGHPLQFGYDLLWGSGQSIGFHTTPWGPVHTPGRGVELIGLYLTRLNTYLWELPFPSLIIPALGLWFARELRGLERYLVVAAALVGVGYWAYWHDGFYLGPRFVFTWLPLLVLWSARGLRATNSALASRPPVQIGARAALWTGVAYAALTIATVRVPSYRNGMSSMRIPVRAAEAAGVHNALVLVQESWGAQLMVRLWDVGVSRPDAEGLYRRVDTCVLEEALSHLEATQTRGAAALELLRPLMADSARLIPSDLSPDFTERRLPGLAYTPRCAARIGEDRTGYLLYAPWRLVRDSNVYARWISGRESQIMASFPDRPVYRLRRAGTAVDAPLVWEAVPRPSDAH